MAKKKTKKKQGKATKILSGILIGIFALVVFALAGFGGYSLVRYVTGASSDIPQQKGFTVTHNGKTYEKDAFGLLIYSGDEIKIDIQTGASVYSVGVTANVTSGNDFDLKLGEEPWKWSQMEKQSFTKGFTITEVTGGFKIEYESLTDIIEKAFGGRGVTVDEAAAVGKDIFLLTIIHDGNVQDSIALSFGVGVRVGGIVLDPDHIIFGPDQTKPTDPAPDEKPPLEEPTEYKIWYDMLGSGSVNSIRLECKEKAAAGETVTFTITLIESELTVVNVLLESETEEETLTPKDGVYTFQMPEHEVTIMIYLMNE